MFSLLEENKSPQFAGFLCGKKCKNRRERERIENEAERKRLEQEAQLRKLEIDRQKSLVEQQKSLDLLQSNMQDLLINREAEIESLTEGEEVKKLPLWVWATVAAIILAGFFAYQKYK